MLTKLLPSRRAGSLIPRPRLNAVQALAREVRLTTLVAPGGFGKSTLAASWMADWQAAGLSCTWLTLEPQDDEPAQFLLYLTHALGRLHPQVGGSVLTLLSSRMLTEPRALVNLLINDLAHHVQEAVLLLDDYHCITDPAIHDLMGWFLTHAPSGLHLVATARSVPTLPVDRLRATGELLEITANELRFDSDEAYRFVSGVQGREASPQRVEQLQAGTGGWPAALRIATMNGLTPAPGPNPLEPALPPFGALLDDALTRLPESTLLFMAQTSIVERLEAGLCDALTGRQDGARQLADLLRGALLVEPLDAHGHSLRYHQLLRDYLRGPLTHRLGLDLPPLHRRAAQWYAGHEQWTEAVRHALAAGDTAQGVDWLSRCCMDMVYRGDLMTLLSWRRQFPVELMRDRFELKLALAWGMILAARGEDSSHMIEELQEDAERVEDAASAAALRKCVTVLRACAAAGADDTLQAQQILEECDEAAVDEWTANAIGFVRCFLFWKSGQWKEALAEGARRPPGAQTPYAAFNAVTRALLQANLALEMGQVHSAERHTETIKHLADTHGSDRATFDALGLPIRAAVQYEQGEVAEAATLLEPHLSLIDHASWLDGVLTTYLTLARAARATGRGETAIVLLHRAETLGHSRGWPRLCSAMLVQRLQWLGQAGHLAEAAQCLQRLERLAHGLPTRGCAWADMAYHHDLGAALMAWFDGQRLTARDRLARLHETAVSDGATLRSVALGLWLAKAEASLGRREAADDALEAALRAAQRGGVHRTVLDQGQDVPELLQRFLASPQCDPVLSQHVRLLLSRKTPLDGPVAQTGGVERPPVPGRQLTERETEVLALTGLGLPNKEIARRLDISAETVKTHLAKIYHKLDVENRGQAVRMARLYGLLP